VNEFGGPTTPFARLKKAIYTISLGGGVVLNQVIKIRTGFTFNYYRHYYNYIKTYQPRNYVDNPVSNSSNIYVYAGFLLYLEGV